MICSTHTNEFSPAYTHGKKRVLVGPTTKQNKTDETKVSRTSTCCIVALVVNMLRDRSYARRKEKGALDINSTELAPRPSIGATVRQTNVHLAKKKGGGVNQHPHQRCTPFVACCGLCSTKAARQKESCESASGLPQLLASVASSRQAKSCTTRVLR